MKHCPHCQGLIRQAAGRCRHCGRWVFDDEGRRADSDEVLAAQGQSARRARRRQSGTPRIQPARLLAVTLVLTALAFSAGVVASQILPDLLAALRHAPPTTPADARPALSPAGIGVLVVVFAIGLRVTLPLWRR